MANGMIQGRHTAPKKFNRRPVLSTFLQDRPIVVPAVGFFVGISPFPLFHDGSKTVVLCQEYFSALVVNALPSWFSRGSNSALSTVQMACQ
ncbi:MAG TPA: hypothetical protein VMM76_21335 [Pirellulaceae bacterium]|nr:hypothetical protein [Pirellulaceae bacterium]